MWELLRILIQIVEPFFVPICFVLAWGFLMVIAWSLGAAIQDTVRQTKQMHQIPCADCVFFTGNYYLKCPVQPKIALSEAAINCPDYSSRNLTSTL